MGVFESACKMVPMELDMRFMDDEDEDDSDDEDNYCNTAPNVYWHLCFVLRWSLQMSQKSLKSPKTLSQVFCEAPVAPEEHWLVTRWKTRSKEIFSAVPKIAVTVVLNMLSWDFKNNVATATGDDVHMHATVETGPFDHVDFYWYRCKCTRHKTYCSHPRVE